MNLPELALRFLVGALVVSAFSAVGEAFEPKRFAGIFGAAPSVALATLGLTFGAKGPAYVATEGRSMVLGGVAFVAYCAACAVTSKRQALPVWLGAASAWGLWGLVAFGGWKILGFLGMGP